MSRVELSVDVQVPSLVAAIEALGGRVFWNGDRPMDDREVPVSGMTDADEAFDALPTEYHGYDGWSQPDAIDLKDFIGACVSGDRMIAGALLSRFNFGDRCASAGEQALLSIGGRA